MKKGLFFFLFALCIGFLSTEAHAQKVTVQTKNVSNEQLQIRVMENGKQTNSFALRGDTGRTDQIAVGATIEVKCNGKWKEVGTVSSDRNKNKFEVECD